MLVGQNVRWTVKCCECEKPRCIYAKQKFTPREQRSIKHLLERYDYSCGSVITPDGMLIKDSDVYCLIIVPILKYISLNLSDEKDFK